MSPAAPANGADDPSPPHPAQLSLLRLLDPGVLADPYPFYRTLREYDSVHWDPYAHTWVVTNYNDVITVLTRFSAVRTPTPDQLDTIGLSELRPFAEMLVKQMLFMDKPAHTRLRSLCSAAFTPRRVEGLRIAIQSIADQLIDRVVDQGSMDVIADFASPFPAIVAAELLGFPVEDHVQLKNWSADFAELLGNFQHNPDRAAAVLTSLNDLKAYVYAQVNEQRVRPRDGLLHALMTAEVEGGRLTDEEIVANSIVTMIGGQETTTNLIGNGLLTLLRTPAALAELRDHPEIMHSAVEELLRYESPSQHTARIAPEDAVLSGKTIRKGEAVMAVMGAANRDPLRFPDPDRLDLHRTDNRHVAFGWAAHFCFGAPLARMEGQIAFATLLKRLPELCLASTALKWRGNTGLRGLVALPVTFNSAAKKKAAPMPGSRTTHDHDTPLSQLSQSKRALLEQRIRGISSANAVEERIQPRKAGEPLPISVDQYRIWLHSETAADVPLYNEAITLRRKGLFDRKAFEAAFNEVLRRHEAWRCSFTQKDGALMQVVHQDLHVQFPFTDLTALPQNQREKAAMKLATRDAQSPIPLDHAPLMRGHILRMAEDEHRVYLTLHHILFDGVTIYRIFLPELTTIYAAYAAGRNHTLPEPALQYGDYAVWRQRQAESDSLARSIAYWKENLAGELPVLNLPVDRQRPAQASYRGSMEVFQISNDLTERLRAFGQQHGATLYMVLLAAYKALLFRYSGQEDLVVGGAADARRRTELEGVVGYMLDTIPIRTRPSAELPFTEFLKQVRTAVLGAVAAADVPFDAIVKAVGAQHGNHSPIFQAFFSIEPPAPEFPDGWDLTQMDVTVGSSKFDLYLELDERPEALAARLIYNTDIFDAGTIRRMADHWRVILEALPASAECPLGALPLLTHGEIAQRIGQESWNDTARPFPQRPLHSMIEVQARCTPTATAVVHREQSWTYRELMQRVDELSTGLRTAGVKRGDIVAVHLERSMDLVAGLLAILKCGAAYLPLDPEIPRAGLALSIENAKPEFILADASLPSLLLSSPPTVLQIANMVDRGHGKHSAAVEVSADDLAYVIHTSGTTGVPKGVEISHRALVNALLSFQKKPGFGAEDRMLGITTISFDIAGLELFLPLITGGTLALESRTVAVDPHLLAIAIEDSQCTVVQATPATWNALLAIGWKGPRRRLKVLCGGEAMTRSLADSLLERGIELWNVYGPTEATIWATVERIERGDGPISIGRPIDNMTAFVLDANQQFVPAGVPGVLYLGGVGLARGYHGNPKATAERFTRVEATGGALLYNTGDIAVQRADGRLECRGRADHQVKVRGHRIELEAVEAAVRRHPQVAAAAARVWPDASGSNRLSVYLVGKEGPPPEAPILRRFLKLSQPDWMIPSDVVAMDALPLAISGKVDRSKLPSPPARNDASTPGEFQTVAETRLAAIWSDVLKVSGIDRGDNFFDLGGHSLVLATLGRRIESEFGTRLSIATLWHTPTLEGQAALLEQSAVPAPLIPLQPNGSRPPLFWLHPPAHIVHLAEALGEDRPVMGVGLNESDLQELGPAPTFEQIAALHVRAILKARPQGPFLLGGYCTGGIVAFETAAQLQAAGHHVGYVILLDAQNPAFYQNIGSPAVELSKAWFYVKQTLTNTRPKNGATLAQRLHRLLTGREEERRPGMAPVETQFGQHVTDAAAYAYRPPVYNGDVLLIQPGRRPSLVDYTAGWKAVVAGKVVTQEIDAAHEEMLDPDKAQVLAAVIAPYLNLAARTSLDKPAEPYAEPILDVSSLQSA